MKLLNDIFTKVSKIFSEPQSTFADHTFEEGKILPVIPEGHRLTNVSISMFQGGSVWDAVMDVKDASGKVAGDIRFSFPDRELNRFTEETRGRGLIYNKDVWFVTPTVFPCVYSKRIV